jgi:hypothetical protein
MNGNTKNGEIEMNTAILNAIVIDLIDHRLYRSRNSKNAVQAYNFPRFFYTDNLKDGSFRIELVFGCIIDDDFYPTHVCDSKYYKTVKGAQNAIVRWLARK